MAETPRVELSFGQGCPDCAGREVQLPEALPPAGDDFDWLLRDYDGFRLFMLEELAARFPERTRWTPADLEVVLVEALAAQLDQLSDQLDRVAAEAYLETARRPESVLRLLKLIGFDAESDAQAHGELKKGLSDDEASATLLSIWRDKPHAMERARRAGPRDIHKQKRMVTLEDYARMLEQHPLVLRAHARSQWRGAWETVRIGIIVWNHSPLDTAPDAYPERLRAQISDFHTKHQLFLPAYFGNKGGAAPAVRSVLRHYLERYRMVGQEVLLEEAVPVPLSMAFSVHVKENFYQSEVRRAIEGAMGMSGGGFFEPGRLRFGEDIHLSDIVHQLMMQPGVAQVCVDRFKRMGSRFPDRVEQQHIRLDGLEVAVCDNDPAQPGRGHYSLTLHGGRRG